MTGNNTSTGFLKDVVAYVDVWSASKMDDYSDPFIQQLQDMGAEVSKTFTKQVTHVVFKHGRPSTWKKAQKIGARIVSVHWVARCKEINERVDENLFPAQNEESKLHHLNKRTHRCMQPKDIPIKTPENDRRLKKKFDKLMEGLISSSPVVSNSSTFVIDEENGVVYSPSLKRSDGMAQRLREMRAQREHLSPTVSQMGDSASGCNSPLRPPPGASPTLSFLQQLEEEPLDCFSTSHYHSSKKRDKQEKQNCHNLKMKMTSKAKKQTPPESDTAMVMCNLGGVEMHSKVSPISSRSRRSFVNHIGGKKKSTLKSFKETKKRKQSSHLKPQTENSEISTELSGSPERPKSSLPESLTKINHKNIKSIQLSSDLQTNCKSLYSKKQTSSNSCFTEIESDISVTPKPVRKYQRQTSVLCSAYSVGDVPDRDVLDVDGEVFEDYFSPANNALKQKVILFGPTPERLHMPSFDLEDSIKRKGKRSFGKKRKHENINIKDLLVGSSGPAPETHESRPECLSVGTCGLASFEEIKLDSSAKKQRKQPRLSSIELHPASEKKTSTATSPVSSSAVNMNLQVQNCPETAPDPKHAIEKRQMGLEIVGKENESITDGSIERNPEMSNKPSHTKKDKFMKKNRSLVMTSMPTEKQEVVFQLVRNLGGFTVVDNVCESTTHVVSGSPRRTLNILLGIARGCWILSFEWILWCLEHRQWVPEEPYELSDHFPAAPICRLQQHLSAGEHQQDLFQHQRPMFVSPNSQPPCNSLTELIQLCGGTVCRSVRQAGIFIGQYNGKKTEGSCNLSEQWILDCVTHLTLLPFENYVLE
ncbi:microcephalin isoform X1 [Carassius gibelio]|uniref:microcephalin isoform X1 n=1 Tax=Carassius gibelio TaxID=101364 RepID=UPI002277D314|nr:microcephalin isoform X1 [Carassius gibelio]XP_052429236.1 microcephalin isoform X1 [Carassius gibelio]